MYRFIDNVYKFIYNVTIGGLYRGRLGGALWQW